MPRNGSGVYSLPEGNPVVVGSIIEATWANPTMTDIANELTGSLPRNGQAPMTGPLILARDAQLDSEAVSLRQLNAVVTSFDNFVLLSSFVGADPTGVEDSTDALIAAIAYAKSVGVNAVNCGGGKWRIHDGAITIDNITLFAYAPPDFGNTYGDSGGTFLLTNTTTSPFILGQGWRLEGLTFYYPDQDGSVATPLVYPPLFTGGYVAGAVMNNCTVLNAYQIFKFTIGTAIGDLRFNQCRMYGIDKVFWFLQGAPEVINISNCIFSHGMFTPASTPEVYLRDYTSESGEFCLIDVAGSDHPSVDGLNMSNTLVYGYRYGIRITSGSLNVSSINNNWFDAVRTALSIEAPGLISGTRWQNNYHWSMRPGFVEYSAGTYGYNTTDPVIFSSASGGGSNLLITGNDFVWSMGHHIYWNSLSFVDVKITNNRFVNWGKDVVSAPTAYYAIGGSDGAFNGTIGMNKFAPIVGAVAHSRSGIVIGGNAADVAIIGNEFDGCYLAVWIIDAENVQLIGNVSNSTGFSHSVINGVTSDVVKFVGNIWDKGISGFDGKSNFVAQGDVQTYTGAKTQVSFPSEVIDHGGDFSANTFTAPIAGLYKFNAIINNGAVTVDDIWQLTIERAGGGTDSFGSTVRVTANAGLAAPMQVSAMFNLLKNDTVKVYLTRTNGSGSYTIANNGTLTRFSGELVA